MRDGSRRLWLWTLWTGFRLRTGRVLVAVGGWWGNTDDVTSIREEEAGMMLFAHGQKMCSGDFCSVCLCSILVRQRTTLWVSFFFFLCEVESVFRPGTDSTATGNCCMNVEITRARLHTLTSPVPRRSCLRDTCFYFQRAPLTCGALISRAIVSRLFPACINLTVSAPQ